MNYIFATTDMDIDISVNVLSNKQNKYLLVYVYHHHHDHDCVKLLQCLSTELLFYILLKYDMLHFCIWNPISAINHIVMLQQSGVW